MDLYPRLHVVAYEAVLDGGALEIGVEDLTAPALKAMMLSRSLDAWMGRHPVPAKDIVTSLTPTARRSAAMGRLRLPRLAEEFRNFAERVHGIGGPSAMREFLESAEMCRTLVGDAAALLRDVAAAGLGDPQEFTHFSNPLTGELQTSAVQPTSWRKVTAVLRRAAERDGEARRSMPLIGTDEWIDRLAPPFLFGTSRARWGGIDPLRYAEHVAAGEVDLLAFVCGNRGSECLDGKLLETWRLDEAAADYLERTPTRETRQAFVDAVRDWNARQTAVIIAPDRSRVVPLRPGIGKDEMASWCRDHLVSVIDTYNWIGPVVDLPVGSPAMR